MPIAPVRRAYPMRVMVRPVGILGFSCKTTHGPYSTRKTYPARPIHLYTEGSSRYKEDSGRSFISPSLKLRPEFSRLGTLAKTPTNINLLANKPRSGEDGVGTGALGNTTRPRLALDHSFSIYAEFGTNTTIPYQAELACSPPPRRSGVLRVSWFPVAQKGRRANFASTAFSEVRTGFR
jgi:hypothetical protein